MYKYQYLINWRTGEISLDSIKRLPDNAIIPNNLMNRDWVEYQKWLEEGNTPLQPD